MDAWSDISNWGFIPVIAVLGWGIRYHLIKKKRYTPLSRSTLIVGLVAWFLTEIGRSFYRPYIYAKGLDDWHFADTIGNTLGTVAAVFVVLTMAGQRTKRDYRLIAGLVAGLVLFELMSPSLGGSTDPWDIGATVFSGGLCIIIFRHLLRGDNARQRELPPRPV